MTRTVFANANGLPNDRQVTTARDLAKLARAIIIEFPEHADLFTTIQVQVGKKVLRTHNGLLVNYPGADGMKTGFICDSGFNVVASATREGRKLVAVILGEPSVASRRERAVDLLDNGFKRYFWKSLFGTSLDGLAIQASLSSGPTHLRDSVCGAGKPKATRKKVVRKKKNRRGAPQAPARGEPSYPANLSYLAALALSARLCDARGRRGAPSRRTISPRPSPRRRAPARTWTAHRTPMRCSASRMSTATAARIGSPITPS